ncbi:hypothetical protein D3C87_38970 [compost metagenome]
MKELTKEEKARKREILDSLKNWTDRPEARSGEPFSTFFSKHKQFSFDCYYHEPTCITVYFGIQINSNGLQEVVVQVIPEYQDDSDFAYNHVLTCPVIIPLNLGPIDEKEALKRIKRWDRYGEKWMENYQEPFFKAISIPIDDFIPRKNSFTAYFALKEVIEIVNGKAVKKLDFDLILQREGETIYLDTVHLIPPLRPQKAYILSQIPTEIILF